MTGCMILKPSPMVLVQVNQLMGSSLKSRVTTRLKAKAKRRLIKLLFQNPNPQKKLPIEIKTQK
jgi:hypothetical protein